MAQRAIDDAFADGVKRLYAVLVEGLIDPQPAMGEIAGRFKRGLANHAEAHARASAIIETFYGGKQS